MAKKAYRVTMDPSPGGMIAKVKYKRKLIAFAVHMDDEWTVYTDDTMEPMIAFEELDDAIDWIIREHQRYFEAVRFKKKGLNG